MTSRRPVPRRNSARPPAPREHGAWGILLIPFATAVAVAGTWTLPLALLLASILAFYVARTSYLKRETRWTIMLLAGSAACGAPLVLAWQRWWLLVFGAIAAWLAFRKTNRTLAGELVAVGGLTLTAPAAWYVAGGQLDAMAARLWLLNTCYFASGVLYVKMHVAAAIQRQPLPAIPARLRCGRSNLLFHAGLLGVLLITANAGLIHWLVLLAFAPALLRAVAGTLMLSPTLRIKRLGWTEVGHSIAFAALLILALRVGP